MSFMTLDELRRYTPLLSQHRLDSLYLERNPQDKVEEFALSQEENIVNAIVGLEFFHARNQQLPVRLVHNGKRVCIHQDDVILALAYAYKNINEIPYENHAFRLVANW